ncbi:hypothetical protein TSAR_001321 [Trichomalopsis sarcophagae]|uniref:Uncharacterized protein n=1 Tax=Trichomalopsis sarcophagae TaxID=543379 RepID=A0A232EZR6_9HYME|nr:hypothetical protein TSAR_001321 [Trichomalopsis sarcophagae]
MALCDEKDEYEEIIEKSASEKSRATTCDLVLQSESDNQDVALEENNFSLNEDTISNNECSESTFIQKLRNWIVKSQIPQIYSDKLLKIFKEDRYPQMIPSCTKAFLNSDLKFNIQEMEEDRYPQMIPSCTKAFLNSDLKFNIQEMEVSVGSMCEFYHFGIKKKLQDVVKVKLHESNLLQLSVNIDGFSPFKSSTLVVWAILVKIFKKGGVYYKLFTASVYAGHGKPKNQHDYLKSFFQEVQEMISDEQEKVLGIMKTPSVSLLTLLDPPNRHGVTVCSGPNASALPRMYQEDFRIFADCIRTQDSIQCN